MANTRYENQTFPAYTNGFSKIKVNLINFHPAPFSTIWQWYKRTWPELQTQEFDPTNEFHLKACRDVLARRALPSPLETIFIEYEVIGLSRLCHSQLVRSRAAVHAVESQMPSPIPHNVVIPTAILKNDKLKAKTLELVRLSQELYEEMLEEGIVYQDARYCTLHGQDTSLISSTNISTLIGVCALRLESSMADEINMVYRLLIRELRNKTKGILGWDELINKLQPMGGTKNCVSFDRVFGNIGLNPSVSNEVPSLINEEFPADFDFSKSSWYYEMLALPEDLLLPGEKSMIEAWKTVGFVERLKQVEAMR